MNVVIAQLQHETNTFSPVPTPLARFARVGDEPLRGVAAIAEYRGTGSALSGMLDEAERAGVRIEVALAANAEPSGPVQTAAFEAMAGAIGDAVRKGCDAVLLDLHGAMVTEQYEDGEGELLRRLRAIAPRIPIGVALDMHANVSEAMIAQATVVAGYQTYPHVDAFDTGRRAARPVLAMLTDANATNGGPPTIAWGRVPMLPHVMRQSTLDSPNREIQARCRQMEREGALAASVFVGFPHADIPMAGLSAVVVTAGDAALAARWRHELLQMAWQARADFVYRPEPLPVSIARAAELAATEADGPVVLLDHYDNCASGGTMDTTAVLAAMLKARLTHAAAFAICDPDAVQRMRNAGLGATVRLALGGKIAMPALGLAGEPLDVTGRVDFLGDGLFRNRGPMSRGERGNLGPCGLLKVGGVDIAILSRHTEPFDIEALRAVGLDPQRLRFLMLKSRVHWRAGLGPMARAVVACAGRGVCTSDYAALNFRRLSRPIYPLDPDTVWPGETR